jgi:hypothetical protein
VIHNGYVEEGTALDEPLGELDILGARLRIPARMVMTEDPPCRLGADEGAKNFPGMSGRPGEGPCPHKGEDNGLVLDIEPQDIEALPGLVGKVRKNITIDRLGGIERGILHFPLAQPLPELERRHHGHRLGHSDPGDLEPLLKMKIGKLLEPPEPLEKSLGKLQDILPICTGAKKDRQKLRIG